MTLRRTFLKHLGAGATLALSRAQEILKSPKFERDPFSLGIASGDPTDRSVILWTRLAPEPLLPGGGMPEVAVPVRWQLASDQQFRRIVQEGTSMATPDLAHSIHVDVQGLNPNTHYWYRFAAGNAESKTGRTLTLPSASQNVTKARFTTCSCQHFEQGYFSAYTHMINDDPDFVVHLGDYIYDVSFGASVRQHIDNSPLLSVDDFRRRHALYKSDQFLQEAHRNLPFFAVLDNHDALPDGDPGQVAVRAAAYRAWYEHMPIRGWYRPGSAALATYQSLDIGTLLRLNILDTRQFRSNANISEGDPSYGFGIFRPDVPERHNVERTMLGAEQMNWLNNRLNQSEATWNVVASTVPVGEFELRRDGDPRPHYYYSSWDGYPANREALFEALSQVANAVVLSGDIHSFWAKELEATIDGKNQAIATEFVTSALSAGWPEPLATPIAKNLARNPATRFYDDTYRGYALHDVTPDEWTTRLRGIDAVDSQSPNALDVAAFKIAAGVSGAARV